MKYYQYGAHVFYAVGEEMHMKVSSYPFVHGIEFHTNKNYHPLILEGIREVTEKEFEEAEKEVRRMMFGSKHSLTYQSEAA